MKNDCGTWTWRALRSNRAHVCHKHPFHRFMTFFPSSNNIRAWGQCGEQVSLVTFWIIQEYHCLLSCWCHTFRSVGTLRIRKYIISSSISWQEINFCILCLCSEVTSTTLFRTSNILSLVVSHYSWTLLKRFFICWNSGGPFTFSYL